MRLFNNIALPTVSITACLMIAGCQTIDTASASTVPVSKPDTEGLFIDASEDIPLENRNRRKWGNPVVADLDQDGFLDLLLTDHGYAVKLYWNNQGTYSKGWDVIVGDTHGIAVADYNEDGNIDFMITRGGGSGTNNRTAKIYTVTKDRKILDAEPFSRPLKNMRGRTADFRDGDNDGDLDLYLLGFPSVPRIKNGENYVYENNGTGDLTYHANLAETGPGGEGLLVTDFNNDDIIDLLFYGSNAPLSAHRGDGKLGYETVTWSILPAGINHVRAVTEIDYDNDGDFDLYVARGNGFQVGETFFDAKTSTFAFYTKRGKFQFGDFEIGETFRMENYQSPWPHQMIFTGEAALEYKTLGEKHSGRSFEIVSSDGLGWPDGPDQKGLYLGYVGNDKWRIAGETFSPTTGVVHGVKSYRAYDHEPGPADLLLENREGKFVDVTRNAGLLRSDHSTGVTAGDFNNDGYQDLVVIKRGSLATANKQLLFLNNGNGTFEQSEEHNIVSPELGASGMGVEALDYDRDGRLDILYSNEHGKWHLFKNNASGSNAANHVIIRVGSSVSGNATALGALVSIQGCGPIQKRRIGSSSGSYSQSFNNLVHFGLGSCRQNITVSARWSNGEEMSKTVSSPNGVIEIGKFSQ